MVNHIILYYNIESVKLYIDSSIGGRYLLDINICAWYIWIFIIHYLYPLVILYYRFKYEPRAFQ